MARLGAVLPVVLILLVGFMSLAGAGDVMSVEANILSNVEVVSVQVPDYVFLGNLTRGEMSDEISVMVNNTGNVNVVVTPTLVSLSEKIFNYTYFRYQKTQTINGTSGIPVPFTRIGQFNFNITESSHKSFYMVLDLTNYPEIISQDMIGHRADIRFVAMKQQVQ